MAYLKIPYNGDEDVTFRSIGDKVNFLVNKQNYALIDEAWKAESFFLNVDVYKKVGQEYQKVSWEEFQRNPYLAYYSIDGTEVFSCPACGGDGIIVGEDGEDYTCPKCNGAENLYRTTNGVPIKAISVIQRENEYSVRYTVIPPGEYSPKVITEADILKDKEAEE